MDINGNPVGLLMVSNKTDNRDFTDEDETLLRELAAITALGIQHVEARIKAEAASAAKSEFLAMMSHEIRTPLNAILGFSELLLDCNENVDRRKFANLIEKNGRLLVHLIDDILDFSRIEAGKIAIERLNINLHEFISEIETTMRAGAKRKRHWL